jgi:hypothetical protein
VKKMQLLGPRTPAAGAKPLPSARPHTMPRALKLQLLLVLAGAPGPDLSAAAGAESDRVSLGRTAVSVSVSFEPPVLVGFSSTTHYCELPHARRVGHWSRPN